MNCELAATITALACTIAQCYSKEELAVLAVAFSQLGDTIATILASNELLSSKEVCKPKEDLEEPISSGK